MKKEGLCALCQQHSKLTFEHIPPKATGNRFPIKFHSLEEIIKGRDDEKIRYTSSQKGLGEHSLCEKCNNSTGSWYGEDYSNFSNSIAYMLQKENIPSRTTNISFSIEFTPILVMKQIISFFCSMNSFDFIDQSLRRFVLDKDAIDFPDNYLLASYVNNGDTAKISRDFHFLIQSETHIIKTPLSEICFYPLGFVLFKKPFFKGLDHLYCNITDFNMLTEKNIYKLKMPVLQSTGDVPFSYSNFNWDFK
ncbi:hypothetical protein A5819_000959 [Enterococcus sp. 7E2_DIV0204]|uniref:hypothetical protein n=1 Tax=unclassified Enterococcus TaxID=2608891 RepID=UPI000A35885F|nr:MULTISPECIES: hypothetical protein [unclassified Enterococcus]OTN88478.1 hypothetical protein A5819_000959 [Enterococcus sp. 7E2_DIV0204]OTP50947.1 hypothetical protein A5884_000133 [Enterococcus sp. 7D2_DIV0200]